MRGERSARNLDDAPDATKLEQDAQQFDMDAASLAHLRAAMQSDDDSEDDDVCEVWPEHWDTVRAFVSVGTQWRVASIGGGFAPGRMIFLGLDYSAVRIALDAEAIVITPDLWRGLRVMENEACALLNKGD